MNRNLTSLYFVAFAVLAWITPIRAENVPAEPLPTTVFENLQAGKNRRSKPTARSGLPGAR